MAALPRSVAPTRAAAAARTAALRLGNAGAGLAASIAISRALQPAGRGVYAIAATVAAMAAVLGGLAIPRALHHAWGRDTARELAGGAVASGIAGGAAAALAVGALATLLPALTPAGAGIVWLALAAVPTLVASNHLTVVLSLQGRPDRAAAAALAAGLLQSVLLLTGALTGALTPTGVIGVTTASLVVMLPAHVWALPGPARLPDRIAVAARSAAGLARRAGRHQPAALAGHLLLRADILMVAALGTPTMVGHYSLAVAITETMLLVTASVAQAGSGGQVAGGDQDRENAYTARLTRTTLAVGVVLASVIAATAWLLLPLLFGTSFAPSVLPLMVLLPGSCLLAATPPLELAVSRRDRPAVAATASGAALATMLVLDALLIPAHGPVGAAAAAGVAYGLQFAVLTGWFLHASHLPSRVLRPLGGDLWRPALSLLRRRGTQGS